MKAIIICPGNRDEVSALCQTGPLANVPLFGKTLLEHWLEHLAIQGATEVLVLAPEGVPEIAAAVEDGARWGLTVRVQVQPRGMEAELAGCHYQEIGQDNQPESRTQIVQLNRLPGSAHPDLFTNYTSFFASLREAMSGAKERARAGTREIAPGVWAGLHARVEAGAILRAPVWLGENARVDKHACVGPYAVIEDRAWVGAHAELYESYVGTETYVGEATQVGESLVLGNFLVHWRRNSVTEISDPFLLCSLSGPPTPQRLMGLLRPSVAEVEVPEDEERSDEKCLAPGGRAALR